LAVDNGQHAAGELMQFQDDAPVPVQQIKETTLDGVTAFPQSDSNTIASFLSRPVDTLRFNITPAAAGGSVLASFSIVRNLRSEPIWTNKLSGYKYMRGTAVIRLNINSQPFQQGRVIMFFVPQGVERSEFNPGLENTRLASRSGWTQYPNVEIDFRDGGGELRIPYIAPSLWCDWGRAAPIPYAVVQGAYDWGVIYFGVLSPMLTGTGSTSVDCSVFMSFEDVELSGPIVPESGATKVRKSKPILNLANAEKDESKQGAVSGSLALVSKAAGTLSSLPVVGPSLGALSSMSGMASSIASIFGYSKPRISSKVTPMCTTPGWQQFNYNGGENSHSMGIDAMNSLPSLPGFAGSDTDEMSLDYLKRIPAFVEIFDFTTAQSVGTTLYSVDLTYSNIGQRFVRTVGTNSFGFVHPPPFGALARLFHLGRGGLEMTLKFVKTEYHSGRIFVVFSPNGVTTQVFGDNSYCLRELVDIREKSEIKFTIPYMSPSPFVSTSRSIGKLFIYIETKLSAPSTAASSIQVLVYFNGASDMAFAFPKNPDTVLAAESGYDPVYAVTNIGGVDIPPPNCDADFATIGECFKSIKQLALIPKYFSPGKLWVANKPETGLMTTSVYPFAYTYCKCNATTKVLDPPTLGLDYLSFFASGYQFSRGGVRFMCPSTCSSGFVAQITPSFNNLVDTNPPNIYPSSTSSLNPTGAQRLGPMVIDTALNGPINVKVPHYSANHMRINWFSGSSTSVPTSQDAFFGMLTWGNRLETNDGQMLLGSRVCRSACDDYALGYFIGFLPFIDPGV